MIARALARGLGLVVGLAAAASAHAQSPAPAPALAMLAEARHPDLRWPSIADVAPDLLPLYEAEPDRLLWFDGTRPVPTVARTVETITRTADHGLDPNDYDATALLARWSLLQDGRGSTDAIARFDLALSVAAARVLRAVAIGRVDPAVVHWKFALTRRPVDARALLREARDGRGLESLLEDLQPVVAHYARARRALAAYRALARMGEPAPIPALASARAKVEPGDSWPGVPALIARLRQLGDLITPPPVDDTRYDETLVPAVKAFQARHGLEADGVIGGATVRALNVPLARRIRQLELAMERKRWLPVLGDTPNVFVNVPLFRLWATDPRSGAEPLRMNVVVGQALDHQTPLFVEQMEYVVFRPYWNPPRSILMREIAPAARRDIGYLDRNGFEIVASGADDAPALGNTAANLEQVVAGRLYVRQRPGPSNSLGLAKFIFPNDENVYMHGTPSRRGFARARRDLSHGCIRLEDPATLAEWVLRDQPTWTRARIEAAMNAQRPTRVNLTAPLTVVLFYDTVHVNSEGIIAFIEDIYGHDRALDGALRKGYPYPTKAARR